MSHVVRSSGSSLVALIVRIRKSVGLFALANDAGPGETTESKQCGAMLKDAD